MRNQFTVLLSLLLTISFSFNSYADFSMSAIKDKGIDSSAGERLGIFDYLAPNPVEIQVPDQFFVDGKAPKSYVETHKRITGIQRYEAELIERTKNDHTVRGLVPLAVIDTGMDAANDVVRDMLVYDIGISEGRKRKGKETIIGTGKNYVAGNNWGTPHNLDPWVYVFGSEGVTAGSDQANVRIQGAIERPLDYLYSLNDRIMTALTAAIAQNPNLKNSFFAKINNSNTNVIGLLRLANYEINQETITSLLGQNKTLRPQNDATTLEPMQQAMFKFASTGWIMSPDSGLPDFFSMFDLEHIHGLTELKAEIAKIVESVDGKALQKMVADTDAYVKDHHFQVGALPEITDAYAKAKISQQLAYKKMKSGIFDPAFDFYMTMRKLKAGNPDVTWTQILESFLDGYSAVLTEMLKDTATQRDRAATATLQGVLASQDMVKNFIFSAKDIQNIEKGLKYMEETGKIPWTPKHSSLHRKFALYTKYPMIHRDSQDEFHGTHTGSTSREYLGSLARAVPYKVGLGLVTGNLAQQDLVVKKNLEAMHAWMQKPFVAKAIYNTLVNESKVDIPVNINTAEGQKKLADFMARRFMQYLAIDASKSRSGLVGQNLHWEIADAVNDIAKRKIPFANLSIGGEITQPSAHPTLDTADEKIGATMDFIFGEFQKYVIADSMTKAGKGTMFLVAAGNSNNIGDGHMRTNYPADLRSKWLAEQNKGGEPLPGDDLKNIVIVESSNGEGRLSNFTNKILTDNTAFLIRGENIRAEAMKFSLATPEMIIKARYPEIYRLQMHMNLAINPQTDARVRGAFKKLGIEPEQFEMMRDTISEAIEMVKHALKLEYNDQKANISGTSMATPSVAALAMLEFSEKLLASGKFYWEVYDKEGFRPTDITQALVKKSILVPIGTAKVSMPSLEGKQKFTPKSPQEENLQVRLDKTRSRNLRCEGFYGVPR